MRLELSSIQACPHSVGWQPWEETRGHSDVEEGGRWAARMEGLVFLPKTAMLRMSGRQPRLAGSEGGRLEEVKCHRLTTQSGQKVPSFPPFLCSPPPPCPSSACLLPHACMQLGGLGRLPGGRDETLDAPGIPRCPCPPRMGSCPASCTVRWGECSVILTGHPDSTIKTTLAGLTRLRRVASSYLGLALTE